MDAFRNIVKGVNSFNRYKRREEKAERKMAFEKADIMEHGKDRGRRKDKKRKKDRKRKKDFREKEEVEGERDERKEKKSKKE